MVEPPELWQLALVAATCFTLGAWLSVRVMRWRDRMRGRARQDQGKRGEQDAERLLLRHGYTIVERHRRISYAITVDGVLQSVALILDFVVERDTERMVAEVKTGAAATLGRDTRRQLLEYQLATGLRVLLVDPDASVITEVAFPWSTTTPPRAPTTHALTWLLFAIVALTAYALWRSLTR